MNNTTTNNNLPLLVSGMRPTGRLHLGHLVGVLENWVKLQESYRCYYLVADWHVLTTAPDQARQIRTRTIEMVADWIAAGLNPEVAPIFRQSKVVQHAELHLVFSMLITLNRLLRNPAVKEQAQSLGLEEIISYGHVGYPVLQAADILVYKGAVVPVGEDQLPHLEITREIAHRFNGLYGEVFPEPTALLTKFPRLPGLDGKRMSKSAGNTIQLSAEPEEISSVMRTAFTDPLKLRRNDPGRPEVCLVYTYHQRFNPEEAGAIEADCRSGALGCVDCKRRASAKIATALEPIRTRHHEIMKDSNSVMDILLDGETRARKVAEETMNDVHKAIGL